MINLNIDRIVGLIVAHMQNDQQEGYTALEGEFIRVDRNTFKSKEGDIIFANSIQILEKKQNKEENEEK